jgi:hypothetical protein
MGFAVQKLTVEEANEAIDLFEAIRAGATAEGGAGT